ncbi:hypothetical protein [Stenotrophomonas muris]|uniref:hypothetical protein n=1 Tax=Stenotrophomonas muris TaxID=2963283 RepID=UPI002E764184|nr:hypothetical protein [Stenotrophomonas muris]MBN5019371.1 hypothetical protein [Stenotrophomonas maltophilia]
MSNDNKTLAVAQPGGRVRLATVPYDRARDLVGDAYNAGTHGIGYSQQAMELHDAIIPAQPSPGGQGDLKSRFTEWVKANSYNPATFASGRFMGDGVQIAWEAVQALAARQPVGEPVNVEAVATVRCNNDGDRYIEWLTEGGIADLEVGDVLMVSDRAITDEDGSGEVYTSPPAQAVDLARWSQRHADDLHVAVHSALSVHAGSLSQKKRAAISAYVKRLLIDSQAVGK